MNARARDDGAFELVNTPFFSKESAYGDIVSATMSEHGRLEFQTCIQPSTYNAIAVILLHPDARQRVMDGVDWKECIVEYGEFPHHRMLAIAIPAAVDYTPIKDLLDFCERAGQLSYAELVA